MKTWETQVFEFKPYKEVPLLGAMDEIIENVETQSMELMGMMSSKDVEEFKEKVMYWQKKLEDCRSGHCYLDGCAEKLATSSAHFL